jgi:hypothetical protein
MADPVVLVVFGLMPIVLAAIGIVVSFNVLSGKHWWLLVGGAFLGIAGILFLLRDSIDPYLSVEIAHPYWTMVLGIIFIGIGTSSAVVYQIFKFLGFFFYALVFWFLGAVCLIVSVPTL